jgi:hypothetical protein
VTPFAYGAGGWVALAGDWTGSGHDGIGVFDPATATWYLRSEDSAGNPDVGKFQYGAPGWVPVVGDWNGSGHTGIGVYDPGSGTWYLRSEASAGQPDAGYFQYGGAGWKPVAGDWDANGKTTIGVLSPAGQWYLRNSNSGGVPDIQAFGYGLGNWMPLPGEYGPQHLLAAPGAAPAADGPPLTQAELQFTVAAALARLSGAGADPGLVRRLAAADFEVGTLPAGVLGATYPGAGRVLLSADASGNGWFVDPTPLQDEEFAVGAPGGPLVALPGTAAAGREDLLTAVLHEMGHLAGRPDQADETNLMGEDLPAGVRRVEALDRIFSASMGAQTI